MGLRRPLPLGIATILVAGLTLAGCGGDDKKAAPKKTATPSAVTPSVQPSYDAAKVRAALLKPGDVGKGLREVQVSLLPLQDKEIPICSLGGAKVDGDPGLTIRQLTDRQSSTSRTNYSQLVAHYDSAEAAAQAFAKVKAKATGCPAKKRVDAKRVPGKRVVLFSHDDTWKTTEDTVAGWTHLRGFERQLYSASQTTENVLYFVYDYAVRGNVVVTTVYWERTKPSKPGEPTAKRATEILTKQLQKIG
ncbi:hypothetical protein ACGFNU_42240 [Spirillospora sp. NPDC048911]|uniref:hypothetical protein n=1 Tax=Spirillospora sp. NPDC048911 TaxID=3364527 RepID=UPI003712E3D7